MDFDDKTARRDPRDSGRTTDTFEDGGVTDQYAALSAKRLEAPSNAVPVANLDGDRTVVDRRYAERDRQPRGHLPGMSRMPAPPGTGAPQAAPHTPMYSSEMSLDPLQPLIEESMSYDDEDLATPQPAIPNQDSRAALGKRKPALPLPAPPSRTGKHKVSPHVTSGASRPENPVRMTLAGTSRSRRVQGRVHGLSGRIPEAAAEDYDRSTAVAADPLAALRTPLVGGKYHIVERIGAGGMGKVFKVTHSQLGKTFALKIISDNLAGDDKVRELFYREARMASSLSHPNIASVVDFGEDPKLGAFMVMELLQGEALNKLLYREKRLGIRQAADIIRQLAEALSYIHSKGIVHCDLKTENILLCELPGGGPRRQKQVKLLDFGLAKNISGGRQTGSLAGTPHYVAPERIRGEQPAPSTDIYGLGILFYEMLTGKVPWDGTVDQILHGHLHKQPVAPSRLIEGGLDPAVEQLVLRALAKTPKERHKSMDAFLYELKTVMDMLGYGRRGKRGTAKKVINKTANQRDEWAKSLFDASRVPMALIGRDGTILVANPAFAQFIMGVTVSVEGMEVSGTPLANAWSTFDIDLARACAGTSMRRTIELDIEPGVVRRLLMWLDPGLNSDQAIFGVHPMDG